MGAKAAAIARADHLHGQREVHLLGQNVGQKQAVAFEEGDLGVVQIQVDFVVLRDRGHGAVEEIEIAADLLDHRVQAARANQLDARVQVAVDADLPFDKFRRCTNFQGFDLPEFAGMKIERSRGIAFPDADLADCRVRSHPET